MTSWRRAAARVVESCREVCKEEGGVEGVLNVRLTGLADLPFVLRRGEVVGLLHQLKSVFR